jgi:hypothetical protein
VAKEILDICSAVPIKLLLEASRSAQKEANLEEGKTSSDMFVSSLETLLENS